MQQQRSSHDGDAVKMFKKYVCGKKPCVKRVSDLSALLLLIFCLSLSLPQ